MKPAQTVSGLLVVFLLISGQPIAFAEEEMSVAAEYSVMESAASEDGQAWYLLGRKARLAGEYELAEKALAKAEALDFAAIRIAIERARIAVVTGKAEQAAAEVASSGRQRHR